jgi:hypothetical protein
LQTANNEFAIGWFFLDKAHSTLARAREPSGPTSTKSRTQLVFIFDRSIATVAAGLLTALLIVVLMWLADGGFSVS